MYLTDFTPAHGEKTPGEESFCLAGTDAEPRSPETVSNRRGGNGMPDGAATYRGRYYN